MNSRESRWMRPRMRPLCLTIVLIALCVLNAPIAAAELGDTNGDGRVSFADAFLLDRIEPAPGSTDFAGVIDCTPYSEESSFGNGNMSSLIYLEALRRASGSSVPHFIEEWPEPVAPLLPAPPPDERVIVEVEPRSYSGSARALDLSVRLTTFVELAGVSLVLRGDGIDLRPPPPPVAPEVAGIVYEVGAARGDPGDIVALPISLETRVELYQLRLVLGFDPDAFEIVGFEVPLVDPLGDPIEPTLLAPGEGTRFVNEFCAEGPAPGGTVCTAGLPMLGLLRLPPLDDVPSGHLVVDLQSTYIFGRGEAHPGPLGWEARREHTMGTALLRIRDDARDGRYELPGVEVEWTPEEQAAERIRSTSAGFPLLEETTDRADVPALRVVPGVITVGEVFTRGDSDGDGEVLLTDAIFLLNHLFLGAPPPACPDAADADDDGALNLTDSVAVLNFLFLGGAPPPPPHPEPGGDPTPDGLECSAGLEP